MNQSRGSDRGYDVQIPTPPGSPAATTADLLWDRAGTTADQLIEEPWTQFPPLLDKYGVTKAAPYSVASDHSLQGFTGPTDRIGRHYSPAVATQQELAAKRVYSLGAVQSTRGKHDPSTTVFRPVKSENSPLDGANPLGWAEDEFSKPTTQFFADVRTEPSRALERNMACIDRYFSYVYNEIEDHQVEPFDMASGQNMLQRLFANTSFKHLSEHEINDITQEHLETAQEGYKNQLKRAILEYALLSSKESERLELMAPPLSNAKIPLTPHPLRLSAVPSWWGQQVTALLCAPLRCSDCARVQVVTSTEEALSSYTMSQPALLKVLGLWFDFSDLVLMHVPEVHKEIRVIKIDEFEQRQSTTREEVKKQLILNRWHVGVSKAIRTNTAVNAVLMESEQAVSSAGSDSIYTARIFEALSTIMCNQLQSLARRSIEEYMKLFRCYALDAPLMSGIRKRVPFQISIQMVSSGDNLGLDPPLTRVESVVYQLMDQMVECCNEVPRIAHPARMHHDTLLKVLDLGDSVVVNAHNELGAILKSNLEEMRPLYSQYQKWMYLLSKDHSDQLREYVEQPQELASHHERIAMYRDYAMQLEELSANTVTFVLLSVDCSLVKRVLIDKCSDHIHTVLERLAMGTTSINIELNDKYSNIDFKLRSPPQTEDDLVEFKAYLSETKKDLIRMNKKVTQVRENLFFLLEYEHLLHDTMKMYMQVFCWPKKILMAVAEAEMAMRSKKEKFETELRAKVDDFEKLVELHAEEVEAFSKNESIEDLHSYMHTLGKLQSSLTEAITYRDLLNEEETKLDWPTSDFLTLTNAATSLEPHAEFWTMIDDDQKLRKGWQATALNDLDSEVMDKHLGSMRITLQKTAKVMGKKFKGISKTALSVREEVDDFRRRMPIIEVMSANGLRARHFDLVTDVIDKPLKGTDPLSHMLSLDIDEKLEKLEEISSVATKEFKMEQAMDAMGSSWQGISFVAKPYRESGTSVLGGLDDIQMQLDDQIVKTQTMAGSAIAKNAFGPRVTSWENKLTMLQDIIDVWLKVQSTWMYLEPIFSSDDIKKQMPTEATLFDNVDKTWRTIMTKVTENPDVMTVVEVPNMLKNLKTADGELETIQKGLNKYLETKMLYFPRFFFLSPDDLLEILAETKDPVRVQPHLKKCFEGIHQIEFAENLDILAMISPEKETVKMDGIVNPKAAKGAVEVWLLQVEDMMRQTMRAVCCEAIAAYARDPREQWVTEWPGQLVLNCSQCYFTSEVEQAVTDKGTAGVKEYLEVCEKQLMKIVEVVRSRPPKSTRTTLGALITMDVHAKNVLQDLIASGFSNAIDFDWLKELRYYFVDNEIQCKMISATMAYGYEYIGNSGRLVITPLTDRCYRTLMGALQLNLGGAPEGPAGTGKTETTKDLAKACAKMCIVFNCSDGLDYLAMAKFFKGLASSGAWACFDEFNRIDLEVLSVVAQQILTIQNAIAADLKDFDFEGSHIRLNKACSVFITMNPGYAGRSDLPDNLKALFRPVAMMVPDYALISEIILMSNGYVTGKECGRKIVATYRLCSEQLSSQDHYDYGMRAVISVLRAAGNMKQKFPEVDENNLMLRSIIDVNLPKFLSPDIPLFEGITKDLFPGIELEDTDYSDLLSGMVIVAERMNLQQHDFFFMKVQQLYEMIIVRHGLMIVGEPDAGKTCMYKMLAGALGVMEEKGLMDEHKTHYHVMNPKAIDMGNLYGNFDPMSHEWTDGILPNLYRLAARDESTDRHWVMFDGPVDAIWIENMNTVLDDNKKLCLQSSEIIPMTARMNMMFEPMDLAVASPATVSRVGIIFVEPHCLGWQPKFASWLNCFPEHLEAQKDLVNKLFMWMLAPCIKYMRRETNEVSPSMDIMVATSCMDLFRSYVDELWDSQEDYDKIKDPQLWIENIFCMALIWSTGATADMAGRIKMNAFIRCCMVGKIGEEHGEESIYFSEQVGDPFPLKQPIPSGDEEDPRTIYDYYFDKTKLKWTLWTEINKGFQIPDDSEFHKIIVPTIDSARYCDLMEHMIKHDNRMLFVGPTGTGKTQYAQMVLLGLDKELFVPLTLGFSAQTSCGAIQDIMDGKLDKRKKGHYGPPRGKKYMILVDDLNMPKVEEYGAQPPVELLRQCISNGGWYDWAEKGTPWKNIEDLVFSAAMGPPGGGRSFVTPRFLHLFTQISFTDLEDSTMKFIYSTILGWFFGKNGFAGAVINQIDSVVEGTLLVYKSALDSLRPTPSKSHYLFNLRDFARVCQGVCLIKPKQCESKSDIMRLWTHEILRVFGDRLVNDEDRGWFNENMRGVIKECFEKDMNNVFKDCLTGDNGSEVDSEAMRNLMYTDFQTEERVYSGVDIEEKDKLLEQMEQFLAEYNEETTKPMSLVLFSFAVEHIARICRILSMPGGNGLLVGLGGSGRQSDCRLAAHIAECKVRQIELSKSYTMTEWHDDMKLILSAAGADGEKTVFLFSDSQIKYESFVEEINNMLNTGEVPNLFAVDEQAAIFEKIRKPYQDLTGNKDPSQGEMYGYFLERVKTFLHIVVTFSPVGDGFRSRIRMFPSLVNCCTIDWFMPWPEDALEAVCTRFLAEEKLDDEVRTPIVEMCTWFHRTALTLSDEFIASDRRYNYVTPTSYLELINAFKSVLNAKRSEVMGLQSRYTVGLEKLADAESQVAGMQEELTALAPQLVIAQEETATMMEQVEKEKVEIVEPKKELVSGEEAKAQKKADEANELKESCERDLGEAMPALHAAVSALDTLKKDDITFLKQLKKPPAVIKLVMHSVCIMFGEKGKRKPDPDTGKMVEDWWEPSLKLVSDSNFLNNLKTYDKDNIDPKRIAKIRSDFETNEDFTPEKAKGASAAAEGVCKWVRAMSTYDRVCKVVGPKKEQLAEVSAEYEEVMQLLGEKQAELKVVLDRMAKLETTLADLVAKAGKLEKDVVNCQLKLERAEKLIGGLGGEKVRWGEAAEKLGGDYINVTGDALLSSGMLAYLGAFTMSFRDKFKEAAVALLQEKKIPGSPTFSLVSSIGEPVKLREWCIQGLPTDNFSAENAIMVANARRWPLAIDPQGQANKWIRNMEKDNKLIPMKLNQDDDMRKLENAISFGTPVLLENCTEELDPVIEPILLKQTFKQGGSLVIRLGDSTIDYSLEFKFYLTTKLRNPHYLPEAQTKVQLLNFMITPEGLQDQLLGIVVALERPDLETAKNTLILDAAANAKQLKEIEDTILQVLSGSEGNILEDAQAIEVLTASKVLSNEIAEKQKIAAETEKEIDAARKEYTGIAFVCSVMYFCIADMANIDPMYQYSLPWYVNLFKRAINISEKSDDLPTRLKILQDFFQHMLYMNVCRSLFEKDKLLFAMLLCQRLMESRGEVNGDTWRFLLTGGIGGRPEEPNPAPDWVTDPSWAEIVRFSKLPAIKSKKFLESFCDNIVEWKLIFDSSTPQLEKLPAPWGDSMTEMEKCSVLRCVRGDKLVPRMSMFVVENMGQKFVEPPPFDLNACYSESNPAMPLIFVLTPGSDPTLALLTFAKTFDKSIENNLVLIISLGQGQGPRAEKMIELGKKEGAFVLLQNCHLATSFMSRLEMLCDDLKPKECHKEFRLWLTSYPSKTFPVSILQNGVKMTNEPPKGLKANLIGSLSLTPICDDTFFDSCNKPKDFKKLIFSVLFFHGCIQERRYFGPIGWNIPYEFNESDLRISVRQLVLFLNMYDIVQFEALKYLIGECNYGGRVTENFDRRCLTTFLKEFVRPEVLKPDHPFSTSGLYTSCNTVGDPKTGESRDEIVDFVKEWPATATPEAFGMHANADIAKDKKEMFLLVDSILLTQSQSGGGGGARSRDDVVGDLAADIAQKVPPNFDIELVQRAYPITYLESMNTVLKQELIRYNRLLGIMRDSLSSIQLAMKGLIVLSAELDAMATQMFNNQTPSLWKGKCYPSLKPLASFAVDFEERMNFYQSWIDNGQPNSFWISGIYFTHSLLTGGLQNYARKYDLPIDLVVYRFKIQDTDNPEDKKAQPEDGIFVHGMFLEGAVWNYEIAQLDESKPKVLYGVVPLIWYEPVHMDNVEEGQVSYYETPLYRTLERKGTLATTGHSTNYVMPIRMPTDLPESHWIKRGAAMFCALQD